MAYMTKMTEGEKIKFRAMGQTPKFFECQWCGDKNPDFHRLWSLGRNSYSDIFGCKKCYEKWLKAPPIAGAETPELSSKWGDYMHGSGGQKGGLNTDGKGLSG